MIYTIEREWEEEGDYFFECEFCGFAEDIVVLAVADRHSAVADVVCPGCADRRTVQVRGSIEDMW